MMKSLSLRIFKYFQEYRGIIGFNQKNRRKSRFYDVNGNKKQFFTSQYIGKWNIVRNQWVFDVFL